MGSRLGEALEEALGEALGEARHKAAPERQQLDRTAVTVAWDRQPLEEAVVEHHLDSDADTAQALT